MQVLKSIIPIIIIVQNFFTFANPEDSSNQLSNIQDKYFTQCTEEMSDKDNLLVDWYPLEPYQFSHIAKNGHYCVTGLDIELINSISSKISIGVQYADSVWERAISNIGQGSSDMVAGATYTAVREQTLPIFLFHIDLKQFPYLLYVQQKNI